jgi:hypothetical protein
MARTAVKSLKDVHYFITFVGQYYTAAEKGKNVESYEVTVPMSHAQIEDPKESPLSLFRHHYAPKVMPKKYPGYQGLVSFEIKHVTCNEPSRLQENIKLMNFADLCEYIENKSLPIKTEFYEDAGSLRAAIRECEKDREGFLKIQGITESRKAPAIIKQRTANEMLEMYPQGVPEPDLSDL